MKLKARIRKELRSALAGAFYTSGEIRLLCKNADISLARILIEKEADIVWDSILDEAEKQGPKRLRKLLDECLERAPALSEVVSLYDELFGEKPVSGTQKRVEAAPMDTKEHVSDKKSSKTNIFVSYAHEDKDFLDRLLKSLAMLRRHGRIEVWHDQNIKPGDEWNGEIKKALDEAEIVLLLVSPDFLYSDFCYERELERAMERQEKGEVRVIPIILRVCDWQEAPFGKFQALPKGVVPITKWDDEDDAWNDVVSGIRNVLNAC